MKRLFYLLAVALLAPALPAQIQLTATTGTLNANYTSLRTAFAAINAGTHGGDITINLVGNTTETSTALLNTTTPTSILVRPSGGAARRITGSIGGGSIVSLASASNVTFDGLNTGGNSLTIENTDANGTPQATIQLGTVNGVTIRNCTIQTNCRAPLTSSGGAVSLVGQGDNIIIQNNTLTGVLVNGFGPTRLLGAINTTGDYSNVQILNNAFTNWGGFGTASAIYLAPPNSLNSWTISGNRFYLSALVNMGSTVFFSAIRAESGFLSGTVANNVIGFANAAGTGRAVFNFTSASSLVPIFLRGLGLVVQGNVIGGIQIVSPSNLPYNVTFTGISVPTSNQLDIIGNTVGSLTENDSISIETPTNNVVARGIDYTPGGTFYTVSNNQIGGFRIRTNLTASFEGIVTPNGGAFTGNTVGGASPDSVSLTGSSSSAVGLRAVSASMTGNTVRNMSAGSFTGISSRTTIAQNTVYGLRSSSPSGTASSGIEIPGSTVVVTRNLIYALSADSAASTVYGIAANAPTNPNGTVSQNMIRLGYDLSGRSVTVGCAFIGMFDPSTAGGELSYYHNSVYIGGENVNSSLDTYAFQGLNNTTNQRFAYNNIFVNARSNADGSGKNYAIRLPGTTNPPPSFTTGSNIYLASGNGGVFGFYNSADIASLTAWNAATGDTGSFEVDPNFVAPRAAIPDLHLASPTKAEAAGLTVSGQTVDFDGQTRANLTPVDIGADAGNFAAPGTADAAALAVLAPASILRPAGSITPQARISNQGSAVQNIPVRFRIVDPASTEVYNQVVTVNAAPAFRPALVNFPASAVLTAPGAYSFELRVELAGDLNPANDVITGSFTIVAPLSGTVTVGAGGTFASLSNRQGVFDLVNQVGVANTGATVAIVSDLTSETGTVALNEFSGTGTLTIRPSGAPRVVSGVSTQALLFFEGVDRLTIDGSTIGGTAADVIGGDDSLRELTIQNLDTSGTNRTVLHFSASTSTGQNNTLRNLRIKGTADPYTAACIYVGGATIGNVGTHTGMRIENCQMRRAATGLNCLGNSTPPTAGWVVTKNDLTGTNDERLTTMGLRLQFVDSSTISYNSVGGIFTTLNRNYGIRLQGMANLVSHNVIAGIGSTLNSGDGALGIDVTTQPGAASTIANNFISGVTNVAPTTSGAIVAGIRVFSFSNGSARVYYNSVFLSGARGFQPFDQNGSYALAVDGTSTVVEAKNNILVNTQTSSAGAGALSYVFGTSSPLAGLTLNRNLYFNTGTRAAGFRRGSLGVSGTDSANLAAWQTDTGQDPNSLSGDPLFVSATNLHITSASPANGAGEPVSVTVDIDGETRPATTPDIGADEFLPPATLTSLVLSSGTLTPAFAANIFSYTATVANAVSGLTVTPTALDPAATIEVRVNGGSFSTVPSGSPSASLPLNVGGNPVQVRVTAVGGMPVLVSTITVTRLDALVAGTLNIVAAQGYARVVTQAELQSAVTYTAGFEPALLSAGPTSAQGGPITFTAGASATYRPPSPSFTGADSFGFTVQNSLGQSASGTVQVTVLSPEYPARPTTLTLVGGNFGGVYQGSVPGLQYRIDHSDDLQTAFAPLLVGGNPVMVTADPAGAFTFADPGAPVPGRRFYRAVPLP